MILNFKDFIDEGFLSKTINRAKTDDVRKEDFIDPDLFDLFVKNKQDGDTTYELFLKYMKQYNQEQIDDVPKNTPFVIVLRHVTNYSYFFVDTKTHFYFELSSYHEKVGKCRGDIGSYSNVKALDFERNIHPERFKTIDTRWSIPEFKSIWLIDETLCRRVKQLAVDIEKAGNFGIGSISKIKYLFSYLPEGFLSKTINRAKSGELRKEDENTIRPAIKEDLQTLIGERLDEYGNGDLNDIDVSLITDMSELFEPFKDDVDKIDVSNWNVSNVTNMSKMFAGCKYLKCDIGNWNTSKVTNMSKMFAMCYKFNCDISNWDVSNVINMREMFHQCTSFNQNLNNWDVSNVQDMFGMFLGCIRFNGDISSWNVGNVTCMAHMFGDCRRFTVDISSWNVSNVTNMCYMFGSCFKFNIDLSNWNVENVTNMYGMFRDCTLFNQDLNKWTISPNIEKMQYMFNGCDNLKSKPSWYIDFNKSW